MSRLTIASITLCLAIPSVLAGQGTQADYERSRGMRGRYQGLVVDVPEQANWIDSTNRFWYRKSVKGGNQFVLVDAATLDKRPPFDHDRLAAALATSMARPVTAITLPFSTFDFAQNDRAIEFASDSSTWTCTLSEYRCTKSALRTTGFGRGRGGGRGGGGGGARGAGPGTAEQQEQPRQSPDRKLEALIQNYNVYVRTVGSREPATALSWDGSEGNPYTLQSIVWSPDSKKLVANRVKPGYRRMVRYVESSPADQVQPKTFERFYAKPGDLLDLPQPALFNVETKQQVVLDNTLFPNPYGLQRFEWRADSRAVTFEYNQRGHQVYRVIEADATSGRVRNLINEEATTFVDYRRANGGLTDSGRLYRYDVADGKEIIWVSERDGWAHLYLYDGVTGQVKNQITKGNWLVRGVQRVDEAKRQIWFSAGGMKPNQDPYFAQFYRVNFDGSGLTALTEADGNHAVSFSPTGEYYVDQWSRVDQAPVSQLRRASDQKVVLDLEKANDADLRAAGWRPPEVFTAKARDGRTDIWGVIIRPSNLDPNRKYPVIENIYAGPQGSFVPKNFQTYNAMYGLAELGFVVVQIDGMGTANRSKAFHDVAWKNLGDAGFPDRKLWHKAVAAKYPYYDVSRVGVYGTSAGGQNALGGLLFHSEFYKAAFSAAGCHDNRMDKIWWNEQWMGWPIGPEYAASSNVDNAQKLQGKLLLVVGELDTNVDPASTLQVVNALVRANKMFDLLFLPGAGHTNGGAYGERKRDDFFVRHLLGVEPPDRNVAPAAVENGDDEMALAGPRGEMWERWTEAPPMVRQK